MNSTTTDDTSRIYRYLPWLGVLAIWAVIQVVITFTVMDRVFDGELIGTDGYMRLVRVTELAASHGWYDSTIERMNAPFGSVLHWTRPFDVILLAIAAIARPFAGSFDQSLLFAGIVVSPIFVALTSLLLVWAVRPLLDRATSFLAAMLVLLQPAILTYTMAGRADHHALQLLLTVLAIGLTLRLILQGPEPRLAIATGTIYAIGVWVSIELVLLAGLCIGALALRWIHAPASRPRNLLYATGAFTVVSIAALLIERPPSDLLAVEYDRISIVHIAMAAVTFACWIVIDAGFTVNRIRPLLAGARGRFAAAAVTAGVGGAILLTLFPDLILGPFGTLDPRIVPIWHERVQELRSLVPSSKEGLRDFLFFLSSTTVAILLLAHIALREQSLKNRAGWLMLLLIAGVYYVLSLIHLRFASTAELVALPALAELIRRFLVLCKQELSGIAEAAAKILGTFLVVLGGLFIGSVIPSSNNAASDANRVKECNVAKVAPLLSDPVGLGRTPKIIATFMDYGPELLYRTPHAVIGAPYHRNGDGIWDGYWFLATTSADESLAILRRRKVDLVMVCFSQKETRFYNELSKSGNLYTRLEKGEPPAWLKPMPYDPDSIGGFHIYRVIR